MAENNKHTDESVQEQLTWAKETLNNKRYPAGEFQLDPTIDQLREFRTKITEMH